MIRMRFSLRDGGRVVDLEATSPEGATVGDVRQAVGRAGVAAQGWRLAGLPVDDGHPWGSPPLVEGVELTAGGPAPPLVRVQVVDGPGRGLTADLPEGAHLLGRAPSAALRPDDPDVSRRHAEVRVGAGPDGVHVRVVDVGSTNGTSLLDGGPGERVGSRARDWPRRSRLRIGGSTLLWTPCAATGSAPAQVRPPRHGAVRPDGHGGVAVNPAPHVPAPVAPLLIELPPEPSPAPPARLSWPALLLPALFAVPAALLWHQPALLLLGAMSPVLALTQYLVDRRSRRRAHQTALDAWETVRAQQEERIAQALDTERALREEAHPAPAQVLTTACGPGPALWRHGPGDALVLRLGTADLPGAVTVRRDGRVEVPCLPAAPATVDLTAGAVVGICGPAAVRDGLARSLLAQVAIRASPQQVQVVVRSEDLDAEQRWGWTAWLPHAALGTQGAVGRTAARQRVVLLDGPGCWTDPAVAGMVARPPDQGPDPRGEVTVVLCLADRRDALPRACSVVVDAEAGDAAASLQRAGEPTRDVRLDHLCLDDARLLARALAPVRDASPEASDDTSTLPDHLRLLDLVGADPAGIAACWRRDNGDRLDAVLGADAHGQWRVDLVRDGPHTLIAGTTGSGKSELLTALVLSLAAAHPPERLSLLLVDYKGGTAFGRLADLPHVAGILTDLEGGQAARALTSLRAELRRREAILAGAAPGARVCDVLGRLVVVVDEFRVLAEEQPELLVGLVRVATLGRGLGVHLVLATQRPSGVVSPEIRANTDLRIALRLRDRSDSTDVIDSPDAARLPATAPGRALVRTASGPPVTVQLAHLCGAATRTQDVDAGDVGPGDVRAGDVRAADAGAADVSAGGCGALTVRARADDEILVRRLVHDPATPSLFRPMEPVPSPAPTGSVSRTVGLGDTEDDTARLVTAVAAAARLLGSRPQPAPWLPPLPETVAAQDLPAVPERGAIGYALADRPQTQSRSVLTWNPLDDGNLAVIGPARSGRSTLLRTLALAAPACGAGTEVHVIDGGRSLLDAPDLQGLAWVGTVVPLDDLERAGRLVERLAERLARRRPSDGPVLLLVDGWEALEEASTRADHGRTAEAVLRLVRDGAAAGLRVAASGGRGLLGGATTGLFARRVLLGSDPALALLAGASDGRTTAAAPPGRLLFPEADGSWGQAQVVLPEAARPLPTSEPPLRLVALPRRVPADSLPAWALGVGGDDGEPVAAPVSAASGALVCGPDGSGRSTALARWAQAVVAAGRRAVLVADQVGPCSTLRSPGVQVVPADDDALSTVTRALAQYGDAVLLLDDGWPRVPGLEDLALQYLTRSRTVGVGVGVGGGVGGGVGIGVGGGDGHGQLRVVVTTTAPEAAVAYRGLLPAVRRHRTGLLLGARGPTDGEALGVRLPPSTSLPTGRGVLVARGQVTPLHGAPPRGTGLRSVSAAVAGS